MKRSALLGALLLTASCAVGPDYEEPPAKVPDAFENGQGATLADPAVVEWWRLFEDPLLNRLIDRALAGNRDVKTASAETLQL